MAKSTTYWGRTGYVRIEGPDGRMHKYGGEDDGLDFKFTVEKKACSIYVNFTVSILGLSLDTVNFLASWDKAQAFRNKRRIEVYAGYESNGRPNLLVRGYIITAMPSNPPEMWLTMECMNMYQEKDSLLTDDEKYSIARADTVKKVADAIAGMNDLIVRWESKRDPELPLRMPMPEGDRLSAIEEYAKLTDLSVIIEGDSMVVYDREGWMDQVRNATELSMDTGMLSIGKVDMAGAKLIVRFNDTYRLMSWVDLKSKMMKCANGYYFVIGVTHKGHLRGNEWITELETIRGVVNK